MEQPQYNMFHREKVEREFAPLYEKFGLGTTVVAACFRSAYGKYDDGDLGETRISMPMYSWLGEQFHTEEAQSRLGKVKKLAKVANDLSTTLLQLALAWRLKNSHVSTVITGASKPEQVRENMRAGELLGRLTDEVMQRIEAILQNQPCSGAL